MIKKICVVTPGFPSNEKPYAYTFVDQLVCALGDKGVEIVVITPYDIIKNKAISTRIWERKTPQGNIIKVYSPGELTLTTRKIGPFNLCRISEVLFRRGVYRILDKYDIHPDILYAHFLFPAGTCIASVGKKLGIPAVCAFGESSLWSIREIGLEVARKKLSKLDGIIAVSTNNKNVLINNRLIDKEKIVVIPNAVNKQTFAPGNRSDARKRLGLPQDQVIGIYNGSFTYEKGSLRVNEACKDIKGLSMIYLGGGKQEPDGPNVLFKGRVAHNEVSTWLKAADFFVLPTLEEGCCNAVIEAMSTGLPVITSDKPFNYDILDHDSALLVNPLEIKDIHDAMEKLTESNELRIVYGNAALIKSQKLDINTRAEYVLDFLNGIRQRKD